MSECFSNCGECGRLLENWMPYCGECEERELNPEFSFNLLEIYLSKILKFPPETIAVLDKNEDPQFFCARMRQYGLLAYIMFSNRYYSYCNNCGSGVMDSALFCIACGAVNINCNPYAVLMDQVNWEDGQAAVYNENFPNGLLEVTAIQLIEKRLCDQPFTGLGKGYHEFRIEMFMTRGSGKPGQYCDLCGELLSPKPRD